MSRARIIDSDSHVIEPADLWTSRLPDKWGDQRMHVRWEDALQAEVWCLGDQIVCTAWGAANYGWDGVYPSSPPRQADAHPAAYDVKARVAALDECGIAAAALYPNIAGIFDPFVDMADPEISTAHVRAYNDFLLDWTGEAPGRFIPLAALPYWDVAASVKEIERTAGLGHRGVVTTGAPHQHHQPYLGDPHWDPVWAACQEAALPVSFHAANGDISDGVAPERMALDGPAITGARMGTTISLDNGKQLTDLLLCGVLARFPQLKFLSVESGLGWVPFVLETADYGFKKFRVDKLRSEFGDLLPSDLFHRQVYVNYWYEKLEDWQVEAIGADNILFETDFPHPTCFYKDDIDAALQNGLPDQPVEVQEKILWRNAAELYGLDL